MPYILPSRRYDIDRVEKGMIDYDEIRTCGELNFAISRLLQEYHENNGRGYQQINDILGALNGATLEYYRRVAVPYEEQKIKENGDIY